MLPLYTGRTGRARRARAWLPCVGNGFARAKLSPQSRRPIADIVPQTVAMSDSRTERAKRKSPTGRKAGNPRRPLGRTANRPAQETDIDLERLVWDREYRAEVRRRLKGGG